MQVVGKGFPAGGSDLAGRLWAQVEKRFEPRYFGCYEKKGLHRVGCLDGRVRVVADQFKILELEIVDVFYRGVELHLRQGARFAGELEFRLFEMVAV